MVSIMTAFLSSMKNQMIKIVIVGAHGLLGEACQRILSAHDEVELVAITRDQLDLKNLGEVKQFMEPLEYDICLYTAAISGLEECQDNPIDAMKVNALAPEIIAEVTEQKGAKMVYISTDYVFSGEQEARPDEDSRVSPINAYGKSKYEGEQRVLQKSTRALICRVSWLFGKGRQTFVDQVIKTVQDDEEASYIGDKYSVPNYSDDLAQALADLLLRNDGAEPVGVIHLVNDAEPESWYSYAREVVYLANSLGLVRSGSKSILSTDLVDAHFFREARPKHTAMISKRLKSELGIEIRSWKLGLEEYLQWKLDHDLTNA